MGLLPLPLRCLASLAAEVVLPEPWRPAHQDDRRPAAKLELATWFPEQRNELVADDLDDLLARRQSLEDIHAHSTLADLFNQLFNNLVIDISLKQGQPDLLEGLPDVLFT